MPSDAAEKLPVTIIVATLNEQDHIAACLESARDFAEIIVVDSGSRDATTRIARNYNVRVVDFRWNGAYPKKRQWCLDTLELAHDWVFFLDADERVTPDFTTALRDIFRVEPPCDGYFVPAAYVWRGNRLRFSLKNRKLALFRRKNFAFPVVNDLDIPEMGEIEGHYQPIQVKKARIGTLHTPILHLADFSPDRWEDRHRRYARWEAAMIRRNAYPRDPVLIREALKQMFRRAPCRPLIAFLHSYIIRQGFRDGRAGLSFALSRYRYYRMVGERLRW